MSLIKKIVWLFYDGDTAIGINNEGALVFGYAIEDTDQIEGGAYAFNGHGSVVWENLPLAFHNELVSMYRNLRSTGALSYQVVEQMFEDHQRRWPEALQNEDSWFKYVLPLIEDGNGSYLPMLQGFKTEQRKWWLYNRFRYIDSKYNAGDALSDLIQLRGYAKDDVKVTPYADIYPTVKYGSYLVQQRGHRNVETTLTCPLDNVNDTEIYIYSASQLASVGDLSGFKVGFADFSMATNLQSIKLGDSDAEYDNPNLKSLTLGNNKLLKILDVRNCSALGTDTQKSIDLSGCANIEEVYCEGTAITGATLPNGGILKKLHLPSTTANLDIRNQQALTDFVLPSYSNISTCRLENNNASGINTKTVLNSIPTGTRLRLIGFRWEATDSTEIESLLDTLDTMRGLDENGNNVDTAQVSGTIHTSSLTGAQIASYNARYPYLTMAPDHTSSVLSYYNGDTLITTETILDGGNGSYSGSTPTKASDAQYTYTFSGWSKDTNDNTVDSDALTNVVADRSVYACFSGTLRKYSVYYVKSSADGGGTLQTISDVDYGTVINAASRYTGATPTTTQGSATDYPFNGWSPQSATVTGNTTFTAVFGSPVENVEITDTWAQIINAIDDGTYSSKYKVGNYKPLDFGTQGTINMQITAIDGDVDSNDNPIPLTLVSKELLATAKAMNSSATTSGGWSATAMISYLSGTILPTIPSEVRSRIVAAKKYSSTYENGAIVVNGQVTYDKLWIPNYREIFGGTSYESSGPIYNAIYKDASSRIKNNVSSGSASSWWLRSASSVTSFRCVNYNGSNYNSNASNSNGVAVCFCLG